MANKEYCRLWYKKNRESHIANVQARQKLMKYSEEKTKEQKSIRNIKRHTRYHHPFKNKLCDCGKKATEHHYTTKPITRDDFEFVCHDCHNLSVQGGKI